MTYPVPPPPLQTEKKIVLELQSIGNVVHSHFTWSVSLFCVLSEIYNVYVFNLSLTCTIFVFLKNSKIGLPTASKIQAICPAEIWGYRLIEFWQAIFYKKLFL